MFMKKKDRIIGKHIWANLYGIDEKFLKSKVALRNLVLKAVKESGATLHEIHSWKFGGKKGGVSAIAIVLESHFAIHTWKEYNYATVDIYTCGEEADPEKGFKLIIKEMKPKKIKKGFVERSQ